MKCIVVTPERTALDQEVDFVALPLPDGEIGIARGHSPLIARLGFGEMRVTTGGHAERYYVDGGFVQVAGDVVNVLTGRAVPSSQLSREDVQRLVAEAKRRPIDTDELLEVRDRLWSQAQGQLTVLRHAGR